jgi:branched-chain amino acid transport system substrate-binding protein
MKKNLFENLKILYYILSLAYMLHTQPAQCKDIDHQSHRIGVVYGLTGPAHVWGEYGRLGLELARDEINAAGGVAGKKIELLIEDSKTLPAQAVSAYTKLATVNKVPIVIGDVWDFITNPMVALAKRDGTVLFTPTTMPNALQMRARNVFTMGHKEESISDAAEQFFKGNPAVKRIGIVCWDDAWGQTYLRVWRQAIEKAGAHEAITVCTNDFNTDYRTEILKIASKNVDAIFVAHLAEVALRRIKEQGLKVSVLTTSNVVEDLKAKQAPKEIFEGVHFTDWKPSDDFIEKFNLKYGKEPLVEAYLSYDTLHALAKALALGEVDLPKALVTVRYQGSAGMIDLSDPISANQSKAKLYRISAGEIEAVQ